MRKLVCGMVVFCCCVGTYAGTIVYSYDAQNRLTGMSYDNRFGVVYEYDDAHNMIKHEIITDPSSLTPTMIILSSFFHQWHYDPVNNLPYIFRIENVKG